MKFWLGWFGEGNLGSEAKVLARTAEELGYEGVALSDHVAMPRDQKSLHPIQKIPYDPLRPYPEPITTTATMAAVTERLRFMTYAYVMGMREPFSVAKHAAALSDLSGGRFGLGITPGWLREEIALLGHDPKSRGGRFGESLEVMDGLWRNDLFSYHGQHYDFTDVGISPRPEIPPDILIGGHSSLSIERAARYTGWIGMNHPIEMLKGMLSDLDLRSEGKAKKYVIAAEALSDRYLMELEAMGVDGLVVMPWSPVSEEPEPLELRVAAMTQLAEQWIA
ncbi:MAG: TIGR03619 family F420-dependent LLM class oxidoreductase [Myxococcota bacterium]|nr:TIGR03619 family F420-dependent LLM class oxidoreductase [Myxococcota bacterium]